MSEFAEIVGGEVHNVIVAEADFIAGLPGEWVDITGLPGVGISWLYDGTTFTPPSPPAPVTRFILTGAEWVQTFTDDEWDFIEVQEETTPRTAAVKELRKMLSAIRRTDSIDVSAVNMDAFYAWLLINGSPGGSPRIVALRAGITG